MSRTWMLVAGIALGLGLGGAVRADRLDDIQRRGTLVVGVKKDVPLWGQADPVTGVISGLEPDLAADLASRLGVKLQLVGVLTAERIDALARGRVDVLIATLSDTPQRRQLVQMVLPRYYASGVNILARREFGFRQWESLRNRRVCGRLGAFYNRQITVTYAADIVALYSNSLTLAALRDGRCDALLYDDSGIVAMLQERAWARDFEMPLQTLHVTPWAIALAREEAGGRLDALVSRAIVDWHRSGALLALERKWGIPTSAYATRMNALWSRRSGNQWFCGQAMSLETPQECQ